ncbi:hypothetical protein LTR56_023155 [Elasticomyces elasticus]|nr:hypothetical protein LTR56_023155 [Elasticomyces elasticus]KAK3647420.1 hypothetical protein LTR22_013713 [Elasticomyces elasticus]KAK4906957.1 hypothetical protein LTR49_023990 [Elasticomyces elasticus]KAK5750170.1 hypothetical protein LTS12_019734 [Elasticomyces elasticus]
MKLVTIIAALIATATAWWPRDNTDTPSPYYADDEQMAQRVDQLSSQWRTHLQNRLQSYAVAGNMTVTAEVVESPNSLQATTTLTVALALGERMVDKQGYLVPTAATGVWLDAWVVKAACRIDMAEVQIGAGLSRVAIECKDIIGEEDPEHMMWSGFLQCPRYVEL